MVAPMPARPPKASSRVWRGRSAKVQNTTTTISPIRVAPRSGPVTE
jgi:hypothetical protein